MKLQIVSCLVAAALMPSALHRMDDKTLERGRTLCRQFYAGEIKAIWDEFAESMRKGIGSEENLRTFQKQAMEQLGKETAVVSESGEPQGSTSTYLRKARFEKVPVVIDVLFGFDDSGRISTFLVRPAPEEAPSDFLDYQTKTKLRLPFDGEWFVFWGGRTLAQNYHAASADQRFAYDIMIVKEGKSHTGEGKKNVEYHCFGRPILAPAAGVVVTVIDGIEDNVPGEMNAKVPPGNHVILDHGNGEYSLLAHFRKGSLKVEKGARVDSGTVLGACGNSGNSSEPHLHYHLQNGPEFGRAKGLPPQFENYLADGKKVARGEPVKGQHIRPE